MFKGLYINLDRDTGRRANLEAELLRFGLSDFYERVSAVEARSDDLADRRAAVACFRSHLKAMQSGVPAGVKLHILEDDAILSSKLKGFLASPECDAVLASYDLLFLDMWVKPAHASDFVRGLAEAGDGLCVMDMRGKRIGAADSYLVAARSVEKVERLLDDEVRRGPRMPVDNFYGTLVDEGELNAAVVIPFLTCVDIEMGSESSIQPLDRQAQRELIMLRTAFFIERERQPWRKLPVA